VGGVVDLLGPQVSPQGDGKFVLCERGVRVPPEDVGAFAAGLRKLIDDEMLRRETGARGLQFVTANYSKERLLTDIEQLYADLLKEDSERGR
jgi:glycosyltransferase involved in cell wall biosynthesis